MAYYKKELARNEQSARNVYWGNSASGNARDLWVNSATWHLRLWVRTWSSPWVRICLSVSFLGHHSTSVQVMVMFKWVTVVVQWGRSRLVPPRLASVRTGVCRRLIGLWGLLHVGYFWLYSKLDLVTSGFIKVSLGYFWVYQSYTWLLMLLFKVTLGYFWLYSKLD